MSRYWCSPIATTNDMQNCVEGQHMTALRGSEYKYKDTHKDRKTRPRKLTGHKSKKKLADETVKLCEKAHHTFQWGGGGDLALLACTQGGWEHAGYQVWPLLACQVQPGTH